MRSKSLLRRLTATAAMTFATVVAGPMPAHALPYPCEQMTPVPDRCDFEGWSQYVIDTYCHHSLLLGTCADWFHDWLDGEPCDLVYVRPGLWTSAGAGCGGIFIYEYTGASAGAGSYAATNPGVALHVNLGRYYYGVVAGTPLFTCPSGSPMANVTVEGPGGYIVNEQLCL